MSEKFEKRMVVITVDQSGSEPDISCEFSPENYEVPDAPADERVKREVLDIPLAKGCRDHMACLTLFGGIFDMNVIGIISLKLIALFLRSDTESTTQAEQIQDAVAS